ncbi:hypothetical protein ACFORG_09560 [Lutimaribacter marinistellae]|uniref:Glycosyltransferase family 10 (Fucosyltransferase) C-term n=1 Tax=Lutimaribacter marinistellae TaxID=1820329 RepID=A0ABV7TIR4_9RHOB
MSGPAVAVLPYGHRLGPDLASLPVAELVWPLGCPDRLSGGVVGAMDADDHLIVYPDTSTHFRLRRGTKARISLLMAEPAVIHGKHISLLRFTYRRFCRVLTFHQALVDRLPNAVFLPMGTTWVPEWREVDKTKTRTCSLIASAKRDSEGHKLRHSIVDWVRLNGRPVEVLGRGYTPFEAKADGLAPYRYSVVIENVRERNYFSEKLIDAILCETVPIYWGCPNLADFMPLDGIIECKSRLDIETAIGNMSEADFECRLPALRALQPVADDYARYEERAARALLASL